MALRIRGVGYFAPRIVPYASDLEKAADVLNAGHKVAILVGAGALTRPPKSPIADLLGAGVAKALFGKAVLPDDGVAYRSTGLLHMRCLASDLAVFPNR